MEKYTDLFKNIIESLKKKNIREDRRLRKNLELFN